MMEELEQIDRYLKGDMSPEEKSSFELSLEKDSALRAAVNTHRTLIQGMRRYEEKKDFFGDLLEIKEEATVTKGEPKKNSHNEKKGKIVSFRHWIVIAASVLLLLSAYFFVNDTDRIPSSEMVSSYFEHSADLISQNLESLGATEQVSVEKQTLLAEVATLLKRKDYKHAEGILTELNTNKIPVNYTDVLVQFHLSQIRIDNGQFESAIDLLTPIASMENLPIEAASKWYLALAQIGLSDFDSARTILMQIQSDSEFGQKASELLAIVEN